MLVPGIFLDLPIITKRIFRNPYTNSSLSTDHNYTLTMIHENRKNPGPTNYTGIKVTFVKVCKSQSYTTPTANHSSHSKKVLKDLLQSPIWADLCLLRINRLQLARPKLEVLAVEGANDPLGEAAVDHFVSVVYYGC